MLTICKCKWAHEERKSLFKNFMKILKNQILNLIHSFLILSQSKIVNFQCEINLKILVSLLAKKGTSFFYFFFTIFLRILFLIFFRSCICVKNRFWNLIKIVIFWGILMFWAGSSSWCTRKSLKLSMKEGSNLKSVRTKLA